MRAVERLPLLVFLIRIVDRPVLKKNMTLVYWALIGKRRWVEYPNLTSSKTKLGTHILAMFGNCSLFATYNYEFMTNGKSHCTRSHLKFHRARTKIFKQITQICCRSIFIFSDFPNVLAFNSAVSVSPFIILIIMCTRYASKAVLC